MYRFFFFLGHYTMYCTSALGSMKTLLICSLTCSHHETYLAPKACFTQLLSVFLSLLPVIVIH